MSFLNTSNLFGIGFYTEGETNLLGKVLGLDKNLNANEIEEFNRFMNANKIQSSFGENSDSWNMIEEQLSLQFYIKRSEATGDKELSKEASKFAQEYQEMIHSSASLEEFKEKYLDFKARHEEFVKKLNEKEKALPQNTEQKSEESRKPFTPIQVTSKSETYQGIDSLNTLEFIKSQQKLEQILMLFQRESKGRFDIEGIENFIRSNFKGLDREA